MSDWSNPSNADLADANAPEGVVERIEDWVIIIDDSGLVSAKQDDSSSNACECYLGEGAVWICSEAEMDGHFVPLAVIDRLRALDPKA